MFAVVEATKNLAYNEFADHAHALRFAQHMNAGGERPDSPRYVVLCLEERSYEYVHHKTRSSILPARARLGRLFPKAL